MYKIHSLSSQTYRVSKGSEKYTEYLGLGYFYDLVISYTTFQRVYDERL